ncbi:hypothetical protein WA026_022271, partial [Henosepilachna vigintioctopunctata]
CANQGTNQHNDASTTWNTARINIGSSVFIIYINDLPENLMCQTILYVDDTTIAIINGELLTLKEQLENIDQTDRTLLFTSSKRTESPCTATVLGVVMDRWLTWASQCEKLAHDLHKLIFRIRRIRQIIII